MTSYQDLLGRAARCFARAGAGYAVEAATVFELMGEHENAGRLYLQAGRPLDAARAFDKATLWEDAARAFEQAGVPEEAARAWILAGDPLEAAWTLVARANRPEEALEVLESMPADSEESSRQARRHSQGRARERNGELLCDSIRALSIYRSARSDRIGQQQAWATLVQAVRQEWRRGSEALRDRVSFHRFREVAEILERPDLVAESFAIQTEGRTGEAAMRDWAQWMQQRFGVGLPEAAATTSNRGRGGLR